MLFARLASYPGKEYRRLVRHPLFTATDPSALSPFPNPEETTPEMPRTRRPDFTKMNVAAGGVIYDALTNHRVLRATLRDMTFVIAHADDRADALTAAEQARTHYTRAYTILLTDGHLAGILAGLPRQDVDVLDAQDGHQPAGKIKVNGETEIVLPTECGFAPVAVALASDLHVGDIFTAGEVATDGSGREYGLVVFRALADFDLKTGAVERHIVTSYWDTASPANRANLSSRFVCGPDQVVHRVTRAQEFLAHLGLRELVG
jgi:hypothetical protein